MSATRNKFASGQRWVVPTAVLAAVLIVTFAVPWSTLRSQEVAMAQTNQQIARIKLQIANLEVQQASVDTAAAVIAESRADYQLVLPGQSLIQVLPGAATAGTSAGDPGFQPLVSPLAAGIPTVTQTKPATVHASNFLTRLTRVLEFWR